MKKMNELTLNIHGERVLCGGESISRDFYNKIRLSRSREILRVKKKYRKEKAPLCAAILSKRRENEYSEYHVDTLLDGGEDPKQMDKSKWNALHRAAQGFSIPLFERILDSVFDPNVQTEDGTGQTPLMIAAYNNKLDIVITLMNHPRIDLNFRSDSGVTALHQAVIGNRPAIVTQLLSDDRVDASISGGWGADRTPLELAIDQGHDECVRLLRMVVRDF